MDLLWPQAPEAEELIKDDVALHEALEAAARVHLHAAAEERRWLQILGAAGFAHAEAQRLIFERRQPRDEGVERQTASRAPSASSVG